MLPSFRRFGFAACLLCLAACQREADTHVAAAVPPAGAATAAAATPATAATAPAAIGTDRAGNEANDAAIATGYACDAGTRLARNDDGSFRVEIPGNPSIRLARIAGSAPPVFTGASLYLRIENGDDAILSQGDRANELRCAAVRTPA